MPGTTPGGRDGDVTGSQAEPRRIGQGGRGADDRIEVEERLAHPHEDEVGEVAPEGGQPAAGVAGLVDDLGDVEVAPEAKLAGGAERAAHGAAGLAADAERVRARDAPPRAG